jgi:magnesium transporter
VLLRDLINDTDYILRSSARLEQRLDGLHDQYQLAVHDRTEARLRVLTIISVIILPLSLITGFFGMNFPDLYLTKSVVGQEIVLGTMLALPVVLLVLFRRAGWFD